MPKTKNEVQTAPKALIKNINVVGYSGVDVTVYTAIAVNKLGYSVLIIDLSPEKDIFTVFLQEDDAPVAERYGITVTDKEEEYATGEYEVRITYYGKNLEDAIKADKDELQILVTDMYAEHAKFLSKVPAFIKSKKEIKEEKKNEKKAAKKEKKEKKNKKTDTVLESPEVLMETPDITEVNMTEAEYVPSEPASFNTKESSGEQIIVLNELSKIKYGPKYLLSLINHGGVRTVYKLNFNTVDFEMKLNIGHEKIRLKALTENYRLTLNKIVGTALNCELTKKQLKRMYKK